jgi:hypothetical protein
VNRTSKIGKMTIYGGLRLLVVLIALATLGISSLNLEALSGGHSEALAQVDHSLEYGQDSVVTKRSHAGEQDCGPTFTCKPVLLHRGDILNVLNLGPGLDFVDLPRLSIDLWHILPIAPVPIV